MCFHGEPVFCGSPDGDVGQYKASICKPGSGDAESRSSDGSADYHLGGFTMMLGSIAAIIWKCRKYLALALGALAIFFVIAEFRRTEAPFEQLNRMAERIPALRARIQEGVSNERVALASSIAFLKRQGGALSEENVLTIAKFYELALKDTDSPELQRELFENYGFAYLEIEPARRERLLTSLEDARGRGGSDWDLVRRHALARVIYAETVMVGKKEELWKFLKQEENWVLPWLESYSVSLSVMEGRTLPNLSDILSVLCENRIVAKELYLGWQEWVKSAREGGVTDLDGCDAEILRLFMDYHAVFALVDMMDATIRPIDVFRIIVNNSPGIGDEARPMDGGDTGKGRCVSFLSGFTDEERAKFIVRLKSYPLSWNAAMLSQRILELTLLLPDGTGMARVEQMLDSTGNEDVALFLFEYYADPERPNLLTYACDALIKYPDMASALMNTYCERNDFKVWLSDPEVGTLLIPFYQAAMAQCQVDNEAKLADEVSARLEDDKDGWITRWVDRATGEVKPDSRSLMEHAPFVGGIWTVAKHVSKGEAVTWGEIGWAAYDVVEIGMAVATFGTSAVVTGSSAAGKTVAGSGAKYAAKLTAQKSAKTFLKQAGKSSVKVAKGTRMVRAAKNMGRMLAWTGKALKGTTKVTWTAVRKGYGQFRRLPPRMRHFVGAAIITMMYSLEWQAKGYGETLSVSVGDAIRDAVAPAVETIVQLPGEFGNGLADGVAAALGVPMRWGRTIFWGLVAFLSLGYVARLFLGTGRGGLKNRKANVVRV